MGHGLRTTLQKCSASDKSPIENQIKAWMIHTPTPKRRAQSWTPSDMYSCMKTCSVGTCMQLTLLTLSQCLTLAPLCTNSFMIGSLPLNAERLSGVDPSCGCTHKI